MGTCSTVELVGTFDKGVALVGTFDKDVALVGTFDKDVALVGCTSHLTPWWALEGATCCVRAYQPIRAVSQAASYTDWIGNGNAGVGVAPTWDATDGWTFNGTTQYLTTTFIPQNDQTQSVLVRFSGLGAPQVSNRYFLGSYDGSKGLYLGHSIYDIWLASNGGGTGSVTAAGASGVLALAGSAAYFNGVPFGAAMTGWGAGTPLAAYIGCVNLVGSSARYIPVSIQAVAFYDCTLTAAQVLAISTAMAAL